MSDNSRISLKGRGLVDIDFDSRVWRKAAVVFGDDLQKLLEQGLDSFLRMPGLDQPERIHDSDIGIAAALALRAALDSRNLSKGDGVGYVQVRSRLSRHLRRHLQWRLMTEGQSLDEAIEDYMATDLGL